MTSTNGDYLSRQSSPSTLTPRMDPACSAARSPRHTSDLAKADPSEDEISCDRQKIDSGRSVSLPLPAPKIQVTSHAHTARGLWQGACIYKGGGGMFEFLGKIRRCRAGRSWRMQLFPSDAGWKRWTAGIMDWWHSGWSREPKHQMN
jgi:hypothetical protein